MAKNMKADSSDTETIEKRPPVLCDLPVHVLENITCRLPLVDCLALRKVSRDLRGFVDSSELHCQVIEFVFTHNWRTMKFNNLELRYEKTVDGGCKITSDRKNAQKKNTYRDDRNFEQVMSADATTFLGNPKLKIGQMRVEVYDEADEHKFAQFLKSMNLQLNVKSIGNEDVDLELLDSIQKFVKPETLEEILCNRKTSVVDFIHVADANFEILKNPKLKFEKMLFEEYSDELSAKFLKILNTLNSQLNIKKICALDEEWIPTILQTVNPEKVGDFIIKLHDELTTDHFNAFAGMKQWKTRTTLRECRLPEWVGLEDLLDFKSIRNVNFKFAEENLIKIRDILLKSPHLDLLEQRITLWPTDSKKQMREMNETIDRIMSESPEYDVSTRRFSIAHSQDYFQLKLGGERNWGRSMINDVELTIKRTSPL